MDIDKNNFLKEFDHINRNIQKCHFVSFDCEFSGLQTCRQNLEHQFQCEQEYYQKVKQTCTNFCLIQFGMCLYQYVDKHYIPTCYNFYIKNNTASQDRMNLMICQVDCMEFLVKNGMDFKKVFKDGITSQRIHEKTKIEQQQESSEEENKDYELVLDEKDQARYLKFSQQITEQVIQKKKQIKIDFLNNSVFQAIKKKFRVIFEKQKKMELNMYEFIVRPQRPQKEKKIKGYHKQEFSQQEKYIKKKGLSLIIKKIIETKKPLVGHFLSLDLGFMYHTFIKPLPNTFYEYCLNLNQFFPMYFDTKVLSKRVQKCLKAIKVDLSSLYSACYDYKLLGKYMNMKEGMIEKYEYESAHHEAGYDAYITGAAFIGMINYLNYKDKKEFDHIQKINFYNLEQNRIVYSKYSQEVLYDGINKNKYEDKILVARFPVDNKIRNILKAIGTFKIFNRNGDYYILFQNSYEKLEEVAEDLKKQGFDISSYSKRAKFQSKLYL